MKIKNKGKEIFRVGHNGSILMGNNIFFKHSPYWEAGELFCNKTETVKYFCNARGFGSFNVIGMYNGKYFYKIETIKTEKDKMFYMGTYIRALVDNTGFYQLNLKTLKYELKIYFDNGEEHTIYYKDYPDMPENTGNTWYPYYSGI